MPFYRAEAAPTQIGIMFLFLDVSCRSSCADSFHRADLDHCAEDGFDGRGADIREDFANLGLG